MRDLIVLKSFILLEVFRTRYVKGTPNLEREKRMAEKEALT